MFVPAQTPDLQKPLTQLLETKPVVPVTAVPGIPENAQNLDSRVALQWAQPVLQGEKGQAARTALAVPLAVQLVKPLNIKGFEPQGPDPDALSKGQVHPMLEEGLASWINFVLSKPMPSFRPQAFRDLLPQTKAQPTQNGNIERPLPEPELGLTPKVASGAETNETPPMSVRADDPVLEALATPGKLTVEKPTAPNLPAPKLANSQPATLQPAKTKLESPSMISLLHIYEDLTSSTVFAAQRLGEAWLPRHTTPLGEVAQNFLESKPEKSELPAKQAPAVERANVVQDEFKSLSQPFSEPSMAQLTKWVAALEPDSEPAQQAAHMLTQGQMVWQSDLAPGIPMRLVREDAWRNAAHKPAHLEKGAMLKVEVDLPNLGRIRITGSQWGQDLSLQIAHAANAQDRWTSVAPSLLQDLQASGITDIRFETLANDAEVSNG
jgi:hypothetical protein